MAWQDFKLLGFAPDLPVTTPGTLTVTTGCIPTDRGIGDEPSYAELSTAALDTISLNGALLYNTAGTGELIVGTAAKLYGFDLGTTLTDRSGATYHATTTNTWSVTNFGNIALAANLGDQLQQRTIGAAANFASVGAAPVPKASIVVTCGPVSAPFVMVFDYNDGVNTDRDGWKCSAISDYTGWTAGTNSCATGRLLDNIPGPITAALPFRDGVVAWKVGSMYFGEYTGPPNVWSWRRISYDVGCIGKNCCTLVDDVIYFASDAGLWAFDGSYPKLIQGHVRNWWTEQIIPYAGSPALNFCSVKYDRIKHTVWFNEGTHVTAMLSAVGLVHNVVSGLWTQGPGWISGAVRVQEVISARYFVSQNKKIGIFTYDTATPTHAASDFYTWVFYDQVSNAKIKGVRPHWSGNYGPSTSSVAWLSGFIYSFAAERDIQPGAVNNILGSFTLAPRVPGKLDGVGSGEMVLARVNVASGSSFEFTGIAIDVDKAGKS